MDVDAIEAARVLLLEEIAELSAVGRLWRQHAAAHLAEGLDTELRGGARRITGDDQALALLKAAARDLRAAADGLHAAAVKFRSLGHGWDANRTYHAAQEAVRAAEGIDPT